MTSRCSSFAIREALIVGESAEMAAVVDAVEEAAEGDAPVLIEGERGTGRELVARAIHYASARRGADFLAVKAATIPRPLIDEELYAPRTGTLRRVQGGTLLLKDVAALPRGPQRQLARVLRKRDKGREKEREDSGETFDVRVLAASDGDLAPAVAAEAFDRELYDRLGAKRIRIPPLRRRIADLPRLAKDFVRQVAEETGRSRLSLSARAIERLQSYPWPGNVAELKDVARRLVLRARKSPVEAGDVEAVLPEVAERIPLEDMAFEDIVRAKLRSFLRRVEGYPVENLYGDVIARVERPLLALVMEHTGGNQLRASEILGLNRNTLRKKLKDHGVGEDSPPGPRRR